jgi:hypothetical protein
MREGAGLLSINGGESLLVAHRFDAKIGTFSVTPFALGRCVTVELGE